MASTDDEAPKLLELARKRDGDRAVYAVSSSVWIDDNGLMFAGSEAVKLGILRAQGGAGGRRRLDSLKQELSQIQSAHDVSSKLLEPDLNPSGVRLTYDHAITFYLSGPGTDLACSELQAQNLSRYVKRRFTLPWWWPEQAALGQPSACRTTGPRTGSGGHVPRPWAQAAFLRRSSRRRLTWSPARKLNCTGYWIRNPRLTKRFQRDGVGCWNRWPPVRAASGMTDQRAT